MRAQGGGERVRVVAILDIGAYHSRRERGPFFSKK